jgi:hypothetical protein
MNELHYKHWLTAGAQTIRDTNYSFRVEIFWWCLGYECLMIMTRKPNELQMQVIMKHTLHFQ